MQYVYIYIKMYVKRVRVLEITRKLKYIVSRK